VKAATATIPRAWQRMLSGRRLDLLDPSPLDVEISDIAHGLARVARWNGQTEGDHAYSVAQHSLLVEAILGRRKAPTGRLLLLAALVHDGPEYVIGDMISPFKAVIGGAYKQVVARLQRAVHLRVGLPAELPASWRDRIKKADRVAAYFEAVGLAGFDHEEAARIFGRPRGLEAGAFAPLLAPMPTAQAQAAYLTRYAELSDESGN